MSYQSILNNQSAEVIFLIVIILREIRAQVKSENMELSTTQNTDYMMSTRQNTDYMMRITERK